VVDPQVSHTTADEHVVEHVYAAYGFDRWIEAGWAEVSWRDNRQYIYEFDSANNTWNWYDQYTLTPGTPVIGDYADLGSDALIGFSGANHSYNGFENYSDRSVMTIMSPSHTDESSLYNGSLWNTWDHRFQATTQTRADGVYKMQMIADYYDFWISASGLYLPLILNNF
jgi:hypothetical protein